MMRFLSLICALLMMAALLLPGIACGDALPAEEVGMPVSAPDTVSAGPGSTQGSPWRAIGLGVAAGAALAAAAVALMRYQARPAFPADSRMIVILSPEEQGWIPLAPCGKGSLTLARLMLSCQLYPPPGMPMEALNDLVLSPARDGAVQLCPGRRARAMADGLPGGPVTLHPGSELALPGITLRYIHGGDTPVPGKHGKARTFA
ncbi:MAG: hypothetical protein ACI4ML_07685 [Aristaeellaceae bacterium]